MRFLRIAILVLPLLALVLVFSPSRTSGIVVGSKSFTESVILGEMLTQLIQSTGVDASHQAELGGTRILWEALLAGDIDAYAEYTGTITQEILAGQNLSGYEQIRVALAKLGIGVTKPLGFNNTYAIGVRKEMAAELDLHTISDLRKYPELRFGFTNEFMDRGDGWPSLREHYALPQKSVRGLDHDLAYHALTSGAIDVTDLYATDAKIQKYDIAILEDDLQHFPKYQAVIVFREELGELPGVVEAIRQLEGRIGQETMIALNAQVELESVPEPIVASEFLEKEFGISVDVNVATWKERVFMSTREHLRLVLVSLGAALIVAIPLGVWAAKRPRTGQGILAAVGIIQTIPSLALLVLLMKPLGELSERAPVLREWGVTGVGEAPAIVALFLYSLLPIVRNTYAGLQGIRLPIRESAEALGLHWPARLRLVELPMAARTILAGIKTAAVINIGFATLGALIGAGGYGQPILTGIRLNDYGLILEGALPAAGLAIVVQVWFEFAERLVVPRGLRLTKS